MKLKILFLFLAFIICLTLPTGGWAQGCQGVMTPQYSEYDTFSGDMSNHIYTTVVVDGYTTIHPSPYCNINNTYHTPCATNVLNGTGGQICGARVSPASYLSLSNAQQIVAVPGVAYVMTESAMVLCSAVGSIFGVPSTALYVEEAVTYSKKIGGTSGNWQITA